MRRMAAGGVAAASEQVVTISSEDKAQQLSLSRDGLTLTGDKGYRMARCVVGVDSGRWYFECKIAEKSSSGHYRLGWATRKAELQAAVGFDKFSFGYRDLAGSIVHASKRVDDALEPYGAGDVVGCLIDLGGEKNTIRFFKNGRDQGIAFDDVPDDTYHPALSLYGSSSQVTANFGPHFAYPPQADDETEEETSIQPISDLSWKVPRQQPTKREASSGDLSGGGGGGGSTRSSKRHRS